MLSVGSVSAAVRNFYERKVQGHTKFFTPLFLGYNVPICIILSLWATPEKSTKLPDTMLVGWLWIIVQTRGSYQSSESRAQIVDE